MRLAFRGEPVTRREQYVYVNGRRFEFWDLLDTMRDVVDARVRIDCPDQAQHFVEAGVLSDAGSCFRPASPGPRFRELMRKLEAKASRLTPVKILA